MAQEKRSTSQQSNNRGLTTGVLLARIISHLDTTYTGSLEVVLLKDQSNTAGDDAQTYIVRYASPFFGYTPFEFMGKNKADKSTLEGFNDTQKSYGMWMIPPDIGVNVLVVFADGDPSQGYWFACVPGRYINHMVPAIGGSLENELSPEDRLRYGDTKLPLPVAEINKRINAEAQELDPEKIKKAVHPIADRFLEQGLLEDDVRGVTTTSARREVPSAVFGISTPGPLDRRLNAKKAKLGKNNGKSEPVPVSRLGGTQLVMDDGVDRFHRETTAAEGPVKYIDIADPKNINKPFEATVPYNEYFRIRTRTGHQLLMHNSEDIIYIANARGTTWVELTSNGKIDIYAADSVSVHSESDVNIRADRDINFEAGRNINLRAETGLIHGEAATDLEFLVGKDTKITTGSNLDILIGAEGKISANTNLDVAANGTIKISSTGDLSIGSDASIKETAKTIFLNDTQSADPAAVATFVKPYVLRDNPVTSIEAGWDAARYQSGVTKSIMTRIPMHEPWALHENQTPNFLVPDALDRDTPGQPATIVPSQAAPPGTASERETEAMRFFISKGWTKVQAAGIVGNLVKESNLNPSAVNKNDAGPGKDSVGIAQWNTSRLANLQSYANTKGKPFNDFQTQLEFVNIELNGAEKSAGREIRAATTVEQATVGMTKFERFQGYKLGLASPDTQSRVAFANRINSSFT
jgi:uncharacterized protein (DUF2345 family)